MGVTWKRVWFTHARRACDAAHETTCDVRKCECTATVLGMRGLDLQGEAANAVPPPSSAQALSDAAATPVRRGFESEPAAISPVNLAPSQERQTPVTESLVLATYLSRTAQSTFSPITTCPKIALTDYTMPTAAMSIGLHTVGAA